MTSYELNIEGMGCQNCINAVTNAVLNVKGVKNAEVVLGHAKVSGDNFSQEAIIEAIDEAGFTATVV